MEQQSNSVVADAIVVRLPEGVRHHNTLGFARTWEAWDALRSEDGWEFRSWEVEPTESYPAGMHEQKVREQDGVRIVVFPPSQPPAASQREAA